MRFALICMWAFITVFSVSAQNDPPAESESPAPAALESEKEAVPPTEKPAEAAEAKASESSGGNTVDGYRSQLRKYSATGEYEKVLEVCAELEKVSPKDGMIAFYRSRAEKALASREASKDKKFRSVTDRPTLPVEEVKTPEAAAPETTPVQKQTQAAPPAPKQPAMAPVAQEAKNVFTSTTPRAGKNWIPLIGGFVMTGGIILIFYAFTMIRKKKPLSDTGFESRRPSDFPPSNSDQDNMQEWNTDPLSSPSARRTDDDLFGVGSPSTSSASAASAVAEMDFGFQSEDLFAKEETAPVPVKQSAPPPGDDVLALFDATPEPDAEPASAPPPKTPKKSPPPINPIFEENVSAISFDLPGEKKAASPSAPWNKDESLDSVPMLKFDSAFDAPASSERPPTRPPWETGKSRTDTAGKPTPSAPPIPVGSDEDSLPQLAIDTKTAPGGKSGKAPDAFSFPDLGGDAPGFAEINLKGIQSPDIADTFVGSEVPASANETLPGIELPPLADLPPSLTVNAEEELTLPMMPESRGLAETMVLSKKQLAEDPELFLKGGGTPGASPAPTKLQEFKADESIVVNFGESGVFPKAPAAPSSEPVPASGGKNNFEAERELGMAAFKDAKWDDAVYHLSIAAALRPDASDVKEQLRRARRMRKEKEA